MQIEYIKPAPNGPVGMVDTVTDFEGNILIATGFAKVYESPAKTKSKPKSKTGTDSTNATKTNTDKE